MTPQLTIYVPSLRALLPPVANIQKAAILGNSFPDAFGIIRCFYQEPVLDNAEMQHYAVRLMHAAERMVFGHSTSRVLGSEPYALTAVGSYDSNLFIVSAVTNQLALEQWSCEPLARVMGRRFPPGAITAEEAAELVAEPRTIPLSTSVHPFAWLRTQAGQILCFSGPKAARVLDHDDPELPELLRAARVPSRYITKYTRSR